MDNCCPGSQARMRPDVITMGRHWEVWSQDGGLKKPVWNTGRSVAVKTRFAHMCFIKVVGFLPYGFTIWITKLF